jgi:hypothetical protein
MLSRTGSESNSSIRWNVRPSPRCDRAGGDRWLMSSPKSSILPDDGLVKPHRALNVVVFPAPLGPMRAVSRPTGASSDTPWTAWMPPKRTDRSVTDRLLSLFLLALMLVLLRWRAGCVP